MEREEELERDTLKTALNSVIIFDLPQDVLSAAISPANSNIQRNLSLITLYNTFTKSLNIQCISSVQFSSVTQLCPALCDPMNRSTPGLLVHHQLPEFTQIHVHWFGGAIQPSHPLSSPSPPAVNPSQHQGLFQWGNFWHEVAKVLEFQPQHQSFQWTPRTGLL